ncbi:hypothetical protein [Henriciella aquimarina]|uniref:hypothetical protein n=1 Tax=Henriciella aquimarina TaxID=545261 RepID=UPI000A02B767|nr:hypothetical protein [Henriciella aquimarina]
MVEYDTNPDIPPKVDVDKREAMFGGFLRFCAWTGLHILVVVGYLTLVFAIGMNWLGALIIMFVAGLAAGWLFKLSNAWTIAMVVQAAIVVLARIFILLFQAAT